MTRTFSRWTAAPVLAVAALLAGCDDGRAELQAWMQETRRATPQVRETVSEPKVFTPFRYTANNDVDPFNLSKLRLEFAATGRSSDLQPDLRRPREPLEAYPLDAMTLVGNLRQGPSHVGLLRVDTHVYQVRVGNYIGQNFGRVVRISDAEVGLKERVQDAAGDWVERETSLRLQEGTK
jgi:type IV pilus assembly protein PilP